VLLGLEGQTEGVRKGKVYTHMHRQKNWDFPPSNNTSNTKQPTKRAKSKGRGKVKEEKRPVSDKQEDGRRPQPASLQKFQG